MVAADKWEAAGKSAVVVDRGVVGMVAVAVAAVVAAAAAELHPPKPNK